MWEVTLPLWQLIGIILLSTAVMTTLACRLIDFRAYKNAMREVMDGEVRTGS